MGRRRVPRARPGATGTGAPTTSSSTCSRSASRRRWPPRSRSTSSPARDRSRSASTAGLVTAPVRCARCATRIAVLRRYRELVRLARREGFGPLSPRADAPKIRSIPSACAFDACSKKPAACTSSSVRSPRPASTSCRPTCARSSPAPEPCRSRADRADQAGVGGRARRHGGRGLRGVRLGAARRRVDRADVPRPVADR